jgi:hypothetical protein
VFGSRARKNASSTALTLSPTRKKEETEVSRQAHEKNTALWSSCHKNAMKADAICRRRDRRRRPRWIEIAAIWAQQRMLSKALLRVRPGATVVFRISGLLRRRGRRSSASGWEFGSGACSDFRSIRRTQADLPSMDGGKRSALYSYRSEHPGPIPG